MNYGKRSLVVALTFPIVALAVFTAHKAYVLSVGREIVLPISGYDPRDFLSGHYVIYNVDYGVAPLCQGVPPKTTAYVCLEPKVFSTERPAGCTKVIRGICNNGRFEAGIERYYIPEDKAVQLDGAVKGKSASIVLVITADGQAQVKDLLVDGLSWKKNQQ